MKTIGSYWPYLSTVYDYVHRAMPFGDAQSLDDDEVYAITAYLLYLNDLVDDDFVLSREAFAEVALPNEDAFVFDDRPETELPTFSGEVCMTGCKEVVEITAHAAVLDVTPEDAAAREAATGSDSGVTEADASAEVAAAMDAAPRHGGTTPMTETEEDGAAQASEPTVVAAGERLFRQCKACHQVGDSARNRSGPTLNGIVGHPAGAVEGFRYSRALDQAAQAGLVWTEAELTAFLAAPRDAMPGTKMAFRGLDEEADVEAIIAYLSTFGR